MICIQNKDSSFVKMELSFHYFLDVRKSIERVMASARSTFQFDFCVKSISRTDAGIFQII